MKIILQSKRGNILRVIEAFAGDKITQATVINWRGSQFAFQAFHNNEARFHEFTSTDVFHLAEDDDPPTSTAKAYQKAVAPYL